MVENLQHLCGKSVQYSGENDIDMEINALNVISGLIILKA